MERALDTAYEDRLVHTMTCIHAEVMQESYEQAYGSTVEYVKDFMRRQKEEKHA
jgi:hypothetical protein